MNRHFHWHTHHGNKADSDFASHSITDLLDRLRHTIPGLQLSASPLPTDLADQITWHLDCGNINGALSAIEKQSDPLQPSGLTIYCPDSSSPIIQAARARLPHALWGINFAGLLSLTYVTNNPHALWHETLHLLGAQDHYDLTTFQTTCPLSTCIMQFAPSQQTIGEQPFLCGTTRRILESRCRESPKSQ